MKIWMEMNFILTMVLTLFTISILIMGCSFDQVDANDARRVFQASAKAYRKLPPMEETMLMEVHMPGSDVMQNKMIYGYGKKGVTYYQLPGLNLITKGENVFLGADHIENKYIQAQVSESYMQTLLRIGADQAGLAAPLAFVLRESDSIDNYLENLKLGVFDSLWIASSQLALSEDEVQVYEISLKAPNGWLNLQIEAASKLLHGIDLEVILSEEASITMSAVFTRCEIENTSSKFQFKPGTRTAVGHLREFEGNLLELGSEIPDFELPTLNNDPVRLSDLQGAIVILDFWATWCSPCLRMLPQLDQFAREAEKQNLPVKVFAVATGEYGEDEKSKRKRIESWWNSQSFQIETMLDMENSIFDLIGNPGLPSTLVIAPDGTLAAFHTGESPDVMGRLMKDVNNLIIP